MQSRLAPRRLAAVLALESLEDRLPPGAIAFSGLPTFFGPSPFASEPALTIDGTGEAPTAVALVASASSETATSAAGGVRFAAGQGEAPAYTAPFQGNSGSTADRRDTGLNFAGPADRSPDEAARTAVAARRVSVGLVGSQETGGTLGGGRLSAAPDAGVARTATSAAPAAGVDGQGVGLAGETLSANGLGGGGDVTSQDGGSFIVSPNVRANARTTCPGRVGIVQSETAVTASGNAVVVAYNDFRGFYCAASGYQVTGWAYSLDNGQTFRDGGRLPGAAALSGDPELATGPDGTIYLSSLYNGTTSLAVLRGTVTDTGIDWSGPTVITGAVIGGSPDKENIAVDPASGMVYLTYTNLSRQGIYVLVSDDGGASFQGPYAAVSGTGVVQGSAPAVGPNGELYVAYNIGYPADRGVGFVVSYDGGQTFTPPQQIAAVNRFTIDGNDRSPVFPHIAVDISGGPYTGNVYVAWQSAVAGQGEAVYAVSADGGATWTDPAVINNDGGTGAEFFPTLNVDANGNLNAFFYSRRANPDTTITELYYAQSADGGTSFGPAFAVSEVPTTWRTFSDGFPAWGDYINSTSDGAGSLVAYADGRDGDPDAYFIRVSPCC